MTSIRGDILATHRLFRVLFYDGIGTTSTAGHVLLSNVGEIVKIGLHLCPWNARDSSVMLVRANGAGPVCFQLSYAVQCGLKKHIQHKTSRSIYGWDSCMFMFDLDIKTRNITYTGYTLTHAYVSPEFSQNFCEIYKPLDDAKPYLGDIISPLSARKRTQRAY